MPVPIRVLAKVAFGGGLILVGFGVTWMEKIQHNVRMSDPYQLAITHFHAYQAGKDVLGEPVKLKRIDLGAKGPNKISPVLSELTVPLKGKTGKGALYARSSRESEDHKWRVDKLELEAEVLSQRWTFYMRPGYADTTNDTTSS